MVDISFTPTFEHQDFLDGSDRVRAGVPNGFNSRFTAIETDLRRLSEVFAEVDAALGGSTADSLQRRLTLPPALIQYDLLQPWVIGSHGEASAGPGKSASGLLKLNLPAGVRLQSFRVLGQAAGATPTVVLTRVPVGSQAAQVLASVTGDANPFDRSAPIDAALAVTNPGTYRYLIQASVPTIPADAVVILGAFQITYTLG